MPAAHDSVGDASDQCVVLCGTWVARCGGIILREGGARATRALGPVVCWSAGLEDPLPWMVRVLGRMLLAEPIGRAMPAASAWVCVAPGSHGAEGWVVMDGGTGTGTRNTSTQECVSV